MMAEQRRTRLLLALTALVATLLGTIVVYVLVGEPEHGIDDADVTMVYARNIARGDGCVYTRGGEHVEGSSSPAWTALAALAFTVFGVRMWPLFAISVVFAFGTAVTAAHLARRATQRGSPTQAAMLTLLLLACSPAFLAWTTVTLMDTGLWTACIAVAVLSAVVVPSARSAVAVAAATSALILTRPEGLLMAPIVLVVFAATVMLSVPSREGLVAIPVIAAITVAIALLAFRLWYFGFPLPNAYYAKIGSDRLYTATKGVRYVAKFFLSNPIHLATIAGVSHALGVDGRAVIRAGLGRGPAPQHATVARLGLALVVTAGFCVPLVEGSDHFYGFRMLQPVVPACCALLSAQLVDVLQRASARLRIMASVAVLGAMLFSISNFVLVERLAFAWEFQVASNGRLFGQQLEEHVAHGKPLPSLGTSAAGGFAFAYGGPVRDLLGLNWSKVAHASRDRYGRSGHASFSERVFWSDPPDVMVLQALKKEPQDACDVYTTWAQWEDEVYRGLLSSQRFHAEYGAFSIRVPEGWLAGFGRNALLAQEELTSARSLSWPSDAPRDCAARLKARLISARSAPPDG